MDANMQKITCTPTLHHMTMPPSLDIYIIATSGIEWRTASGGSVENKRGYHGWLIARMDNTTIIEGCGPMDGRIKDATSYRTELCGAIAVLAV
jgi:hypothetical protein